MSFLLKVIIFVSISAALTWLSWPSLRSRCFHGFYRFLAFESILILILLNIDYWFDKPFSTIQIVSWLLLIISLFMVIYGYISLRTIGKPDRKRFDPSLMGVEKTTELVAVGAYRYIRHPIYSSLLYGIWGVFFKQPSWLGFALAAISTLFLIKTARVEETENMRFFGSAYQDYMKQTRMFIPFLF